MAGTLTLLFAAFGTLAAACSIYMLRAATRSGPGNGGIVAGAWGLAVLAIVFWWLAVPTEKGVAIAITAFVLAAIAAVAVVIAQTPPRVRKDLPERDLVPPRTGLTDYAGRVLTGLLLGPLAGLAALALSAAAFVGFAAVGLEHTANLTMTMFLFPLAWAGLAAAVGFERRLWRRGVFVAAGIALPALVLVTV